MMPDIRRAAVVGLCLFLLSVSSPAETIAMVWFGNSYSQAGWQDSSLLRWFHCDTCGFTGTDTLLSTSYYWPSCWLDCHETMWPAFEKIDQGHYTYVLAQDNTWSYSSTSGLSGKANQLSEWADHAKGAGGTLLIEQMWIPTLATNFTQVYQDASDFFYDSVARATGSLVIPSGHAWWYARKERPDLLYADPEWNDGSHPGPAGSYLNVCCQYAVLTGRSPVGMPITWIDYYTGALGLHRYQHSDSDALFLQTKAWEAYQEFYGTTAAVQRRDSRTEGLSSGTKPVARYDAGTRVLEVSGRGIEQMRVVRLDGAVVACETATASGTARISLPKILSAGVYLARVRCSKGWVSVPVTVE
jgi:hypothetical protein